MEEERLDILGSLAAGIAVTHMTDCHPSRKLSHSLLVEDLSHEAVTLDSVEYSISVDGNYAASLLSSVLKRMQAIVGKACCIFNSIDSKYTAFVVDLVISIIIIALTHFVRFS